MTTGPPDYLPKSVLRRRARAIEHIHQLLNRAHTQASVYSQQATVDAIEQARALTADEMAQARAARDRYQEEHDDGSTVVSNIDGNT